jgi:hypothetical protein
MSETLRRVQALVLSGDYRVSDHGFDELEHDVIVATEAIAGVAAAIAIEDYPIDFVAQAFLRCRMTQMAAPFTSCGQSRLANVALLCWSLPIAPIQNCGTASSGSGNDNDAEKNEAHP